MKKKSSICNFIILSVLVLILLIFSFVSVRVPTTNYIFKGFLNSIPNGIEYDGGVMAKYDIETSNELNKDDAIETAMRRVYDLLSAEYNEPEVYKDGDQIKVIVPDETINTNYLVGFIEFSTEEIEDGDDFEAKLNGTHIKNAQYMSANGTATVYIEFTEEGKELLKELTSSATETSTVTLYLYADKNYDSVYSGVTVSAPIENGYIQLSGSSSLATKEKATAFANKVQSGTYGINMTISGDEVRINPTTNKASVILMEIGLLIVMIASFIYLILKYKELGAVASFNMLIFVVISVVVFSLVSLVELSTATLLAMYISYIITFICHDVFIENIKNDYEAGKKFIPSFKSGYIKTLPLMTDLYAVMFGIGVIGIWLSVGALKSFASVLLFTSIIGAFVSMLLFRGLNKLYLNINYYNAKKVNFKKAEQVDEK